MSRWGKDPAGHAFEASARELNSGGDPSTPVAGQGRQLSLFPKKDVPRLQPHQASPRQFAKLPGIQWHGNYDDSSVSKPDEEVDMIGEGSWDMDRDYVVGGVHAGTKRAAKDALDWHGPFDLLRSLHPTPNPQAEGYTLEDYGYDEDAHQDEAARRGGLHGYLHPVLPEK